MRIFTIALAACFSAAVLAAPCAEAAGATTVSVEITGVRSAKGHLLGLLCNDPAQFMRACMTHPARAAAAPGTVTMSFGGVAPGRYAFSVIHDENDNNTYDYPDEGYAYGNDAPFPPTFDRASFEVSGPTRAAVRMVYPGASAAPQIPPPKLSPDISKTIVRDNGLNAELYLPKREGKVPGILAFGGSEGGLDIARFGYAPLANEGYAVLVLAYFRAEGRPPALVNIPLEYFKSALDYLRARPEVDAGRIAVMGASKGGEASLLVASSFPGIKAVVAAVPSDVVWQGLDFRPEAQPHSGWTLAGKELPYVPYDTAKPYSPSEPLVDFHLRSLAAHPNHGDAIIRVEKIRAATLLFSGTDDKIWPSTDMSKRVIARMDRFHVQAPHIHVSYRGAGHTCCVGDPKQNWPSLSGGAGGLQIGGTPEINRAAREDSWKKTLKFLKRNL